MKNKYVCHGLIIPFRPHAFLYNNGNNVFSRSVCYNDNLSSHKSGGEVVTSPLLNRKVGCSRPI